MAADHSLAPPSGRNHYDESLSADAKREQLAKICASKSFSDAPMLCTMLGYVGRETLAGRATELKEYSVGVEALGRDPSFDPAKNSIVRTQASRLREKLTKYYDDEGSHDPIIITMPKGGYEVALTRGTANPKRCKE